MHQVTAAENKTTDKPQDLNLSLDRFRVTFVFSVMIILFHMLRVFTVLIMEEVCLVMEPGQES